MRASFRALSAAALLTGGAALNAPAAPAQMQVSIRPLAPVEAVYVADLLPGRSELRPDLLGITLVNPERDSRPVRLELVVSREDPSPAVEIFRGSTDPFVMTEPVRHLTSRDLLAAGGLFAITEYEVNEEGADEAGVASGRLAPGTYRFTVVLRSSQGAELDRDEVRLTLAYPTRVELLSPGVAAQAGPPPMVPGPTPRFLWTADGEAPGARYRLRVVQVEGAGSPVEAVQAGFPVWETVITGTSAIYPASVEALRLEPGGTYAWQVTRELSTAGGVEPVESPIYWFRIAGEGATGAAAGGTLALQFAALLRALGLQGELDGFTPVGATLEDGRVLTLQALEELLAAIAAGEVAVLSVRVR